jgi:hypothetical protein
MMMKPMARFVAPSDFGVGSRLERIPRCHPDEPIDGRGRRRNCDRIGSEREHSNRDEI